MKLDPNWRQSWRWLSMHAMTLALAVQGAWLAVPDDLRQVVPQWASYAVTGVLLVAGLIGRLIAQPAPPTFTVHQPDDTDQAGA